MSLSKNAIGSDLRKLLESGNFSDVAFRLADGTTFAGHRAIMAARCSYFASAFGTGTLTQFSEAEVKVIQVTHVPAAVFRLVMDFIYTDDVQLDHGNVWDVLQASEYYMLQGLQDLCEQYLSCQLDTVSGQSYAWAVDKLPQLWNAAAENGLAQLDAACRDFACTHFERVADSPGFFELAPSLLQQLLSRHAHQITVSAERKVLHAIGTWACSRLGAGLDCMEQPAEAGVAGAQHPAEQGTDSPPPLVDIFSSVEQEPSSRSDSLPGSALVNSRPSVPGCHQAAPSRAAVAELTSCPSTDQPARADLSASVRGNDAAQLISACSGSSSCSSRSEREAACPVSATHNIESQAALLRHHAAHLLELVRWELIPDPPWHGHHPASDCQRRPSQDPDAQHADRDPTPNLTELPGHHQADVLPPLARLLADTQPQHAWKDLSAYRTFGSRPEFVQPRVTCHSTQLSLDGKLEFRSEHEVRRFHQGALDPAFTGPPLWETVDMRWVHACAPVLRKLDLTGCHHLPALHIRQLRECRELQWLSLSGCVLADDGAVKSVLRATVRLQTLLLEDLPLITNGVMAGMDDLYSLRELSLQGCARLTDEAFDKVGAYSWGWVWCDAIERVNLSRCPKVTHVGVAKLAQACTNLQQLIVEGSGATPAALAALCYRPGYPRLSIRLQPE